jgi:hypothetical protein
VSIIQHPGAGNGQQVAAQVEVIEEFFACRQQEM